MAVSINKKRIPWNKNKSKHGIIAKDRAEYIKKYNKIYYNKNIEYSKNRVKEYYYNMSPEERKKRRQIQHYKHYKKRYQDFKKENNISDAFSNEHITKLRLSHLGKIGSLASNWQGGKSDINRRLRSQDKYDQWRKSIFERDEYICQNCEQKSGILHAHHIKLWSKYPKLRYKINNGITLCKKCHNLFHKLYGYSYKLIIR